MSRRLKIDKLLELAKEVGYWKAQAEYWKSQATPQAPGGILFGEGRCIVGSAVDNGGSGGSSFMSGPLARKHTDVTYDPTMSIIMSTIGGGNRQ